LGNAIESKSKFRDISGKNQFVAALGHTGCALKLRPGIVTAYYLLLAALILRLIAPFLPARLYNGDVHLSGGLWSAAFILFLIVYAPMLWRPRPDGKRG